MIKSKKQMYIIVSAFAVILMLFTTTYAFFNYTRTGTANTIRTGRIAFNSQQGTAINLTNMFPIDVTNGIPNDATKVGTVTINVTGDTTYTDGLEYLVSAVNVSNTVGTKSLPISIDVAVSNNTNNDPATTLGTSDDDYYTNRGGETSYYKVLAGETINADDQLVVGYIAPGATGVDGNIVIRAYLDASKIAISDTYDESDPGTDNMGTTSEWVDDRETFTTTEWNSLQTNGVSFQIKVESNEGTWVQKPIPIIASCPGCIYAYPEYNGGDEGVTIGASIDDIYTYSPDGDRSGYYEDYTELLDLVNYYELEGDVHEISFFLGIKLSNNNTVEHLYACGIGYGGSFDAQTPYCIEGVSTTDPRYAEVRESNVAILNDAYKIDEPDYSNQILGYYIWHDDNAWNSAKLHDPDEWDNTVVNIEGYDNGCFVDNDGLGWCQY